MSIFAEIECHFSAVSIAVYTALIHHFTCRLEACQALIYQLVSGLTGENGKYNYSIAVHVYPPFFDIPCSAKNYKIASALTLVRQIVNALMADNLIMTPDIGKYLKYLEDGGYIEFTSRSVNAYNAYRKDAVVQLTKKGIDLVEDTIQDGGVNV